jgi:hypothetical protein
MVRMNNIALFCARIVFEISLTNTLEDALASTMKTRSHHFLPNPYPIITYKIEPHLTESKALVMFNLRNNKGHFYWLP